MSSLLEQAIVDAQALREAALKSAEAEVTEKYSTEIKSIMNELLQEADEDLDLGMEDDPEAMAMELPPEEEGPQGAEDLVPPAALDGETACPCPDDVEGEGGDKEYVLDLDQLAGMPPTPGEETPQEPVADFAAQFAGDEEEEEELLPLQENNENLEVEIDEEIDLDLDEEIEFSVEDLSDLLEELEVSVDAGGVPSGWLGTPEKIKADQIDQNLAKLKDTEEGEENLELLKTLKKLDELEESYKHATNETEEYKNLAENLAEKLTKVNMSNAKLLYINKTLGSTSLNERQKKTIVEALSKASTAEEAKVIFETLQDTVGKTVRKEPLPQSLSEAVNRKQTAMLVSHPRRPVQTNDNGMSSFADRMRKLAGIT